MIKDKEVYLFEGNVDQLRGGTLNDPRNMLNAENVQRLWQEYIAQNNIPAVVSVDTYSYKTGLLKSAVAPCVVVSHSTEPKDFRKIVMVLQPANGQVMVFSRWYEYSEVDRLIKKSQEAAEKQDKARNKLNKSQDLSGAVLGSAGTIMQGMKNKRIAKKADARRDIEAEYHGSLLNAAANIYNRMIGLVQ